MLNDGSILCHFHQKMLPGICTVSRFKLTLRSEPGDHLIIINSEPGNNGYEQTCHNATIL